jgi:hypothetical protein
MVLTMRSALSWTLPMALAVALVAIIGSRYLAMSGLQSELARERTIARELPKLRAERERLLTSEKSAGAVPAVTNPVVVDALRGEIARLQQSLRDAPALEVSRPETPETLLASGRWSAASEWRDAGDSTPQAVIETALWAGAGGDFDRLATLIAFMDTGTRRAASQLLAELPAAERERFSSPEQLLAFLTVKNMPTRSVQVRQFTTHDNTPWPAAHMVLWARSSDADIGNVTLWVGKVDGRWKLLANQAVIAKYAAAVKAVQTSDSGGSKPSP